MVTDSTEEIDMEVYHHPGHQESRSKTARNALDVIDLASPEREQGPPCRQDRCVLDNNMAQPSQLTSPPTIELLDEQDASRMREHHKRLWGEMAEEEQQHGMQWGSTGPRLQRRMMPMHVHNSAAPEAAQAAGAATQPVYTTPAVAVPPAQAPSLRRRVIRSRSTQQQPNATAAAGSSPVCVLRDSPAPERSSSAGPLVSSSSAGPLVGQHRHRHRVDSFQAALAVATLGPHGHSTRSAAAATAPMAIQANPRLGGQQLGSRSLSAAAAAAAGAASAGTAVRRLGSGGRPGSESSEMAASGSSRSGSSDSEIARKQQEEEDARLARRLMAEEQQEAQRQAASRYRMRAEMYRMQEEAERAAAHAAAAAMAAAAAGSRNRRGGRAPTRALQQEDIPPGQEHPQRTERWGMAMAQALLQLPRWGLSNGNAGGRSIPASLVAMRDAVLGMQRAGLPPHLLFTDRDFTADDYEALCRLDETVENRKGASATTIAALPTQTAPAGGILGPSGEKLCCAVCLEEFAEGAELRLLGCLHKFHKDCIDRWLAQKACCPICNQECK